MLFRSALNYIGGLIGSAYNNKEFDFRTVNIISCYNSGNVSRRSETAASNIGGLIGLNFNVNISNCFVAAMAIESLGSDNVGRFIGNNIGNVPFIDNYAYVGNMFSDNDNTNGIDWTGLMTFAPVNLWDPDVWAVDPTSQVLPKLRASDPDIINPKYATLNNIKTGFATIRYNSYNNDTYYLDVLSNQMNGFSYESLGVHETSDMKVFRLDAVSKGRYLMATDYEEGEGYSKGKFLFNNNFDYFTYGSQYNNLKKYNDNFYFDDDVFLRTRLLQIEAIRINDALYVTNGLKIDDISQLDELAKSGSIQKINLKEISNFIFSFPEFSTYEQSSQKGAVSIDSELGGTANISHTAEVQMTMGRSNNSKALFFIEPAEGDPSSNVLPSDDGVHVYSSNGVLKIMSPMAEKITLYSISGVALIQVQKSSGEATYSISTQLPKGVYIVRGSSGWAKKVIL